MDETGPRLDYDWIVIGSGFGGSVAALRLAEKGYRVAVLECGRRYRDQDYAKSAWNLRRYFWMPRLGLRGIFRMTAFKDVFIVSGSGVGGGSLGYANTLYRARPAFFSDSQWAGLGEWESELEPHYELTLRASARVANRAARVLEIKPRDEFRYGYMLWLDRETAMPLQSSPRLSRVPRQLGLVDVVLALCWVPFAAAGGQIARQAPPHQSSARSRLS